ncbi:hypothetical protein J6590_089592 [Homalodisca vitripennis]|nr:hypothetical protein J6590_089592 [Homalodisca vitripennis]
MEGLTFDTLVFCQYDRRHTPPPLMLHHTIVEIISGIFLHRVCGVTIGPRRTTIETS